MPLNDLGLPEGFHRSDLLHQYTIKRVVSQEELAKSPDKSDLMSGVLTDSGPMLILDERAVRAAFVPLDYREGFPTIPQTGAPFWHQLEFEPTEAFFAFEKYLNQGKDEGARRLFALACEPQLQQICLGPQALVQIASDETQHQDTLTDTVPTNKEDEDEDEEEYSRERELSSLTNKKLQEWFTLYYWSPRARAHDLFYLDGIRRSQKMMGLRLQNKHYKDADQLYSKIMQFIDGRLDGSTDHEGTPRFWTEMSPRVLIEFMKTVTQMQRVSLGLPSSAPAPSGDPNSITGILRSLISGSDNPDTLLQSAEALFGGGGSPGGGRGRPRITYDENNNPIAEGRSSQSGSQASGSGSGSGNEMTDDERLRRLTVLMNKAKIRKDIEEAE